MSVKQTLWEETEFRDQDLMCVVRRIMSDGKTGKLILNLSQGRVCSVTLKEKVDIESQSSAKFQSDAVAQTQS